MIGTPTRNRTLVWRFVFSYSNPLNYRGMLEIRTGFEPVWLVLQTRASPLGHLTLVLPLGFEPRTRCLRGNYSDRTELRKYVWCPRTESDCQLRITSSLLYHLTTRAFGTDSRIRTHMRQFRRLLPIL